MAYIFVATQVKDQHEYSYSREPTYPAAAGSVAWFLQVKVSSPAVCGKNNSCSFHNVLCTFMAQNTVQRQIMAEGVGGRLGLLQSKRSHVPFPISNVGFLSDAAIQIV